MDLSNDRAISNAVNDIATILSDCSVLKERWGVSDGEQKKTYERMYLIRSEHLANAAKQLSDLAGYYVKDESVKR
jgi:hypothetical protein